MLRARIKPRFRSAYDQLMEQVKVPLLAYLLHEPRDMRKIGIAFQVLTDVAANLIVGGAAGRKEQDELVQMFMTALAEAVADVREEEMEEKENHEHHRH